MKSVASHLSWIMAAGILLAGLLLLVTGRLEYCGRTDVLQRSCVAAAVADAPAPTLAPPRELVFVRVEADNSDLEIGWLEK